MVRNYIRKSNRAPYNKQKLSDALQFVRSGKGTIKLAVKNYGIPNTTLIAHLKQLRGEKSKTFGRSTAIPLDEEEKLAEGIRCLENGGFGLSRNEVLDIAAEYVKKKNITTPFRNGRPGDDWFILFAKRHNLSLKTPQTKVSRSTKFPKKVVKQMIKIYKEKNSTEMKTFNSKGNK